MKSFQSNSQDRFSRNQLHLQCKNSAMGTRIYRVRPRIRPSFPEFLLTDHFTM